MGKNKYGNLEKSKFNEALNNNAGENKTKLYSVDNEYIVIFIDSNRVYSIDADGNIQVADENILEEDATPGQLDGSGTQQDPYIIMSIEDLMFLSQDTNNGNTYSGEYIQLGKNLNFKFELSYHDYETKQFNEFLGVEDDINLMEALTSTNYNGFKPIENFNGTLDGNNYSIKNLYVNGNSNAGGLFKTFTGKKIQNLKIEGNVKGNGYVGGIAGTIMNSSIIIENCIFSGNVENISQEETYQGTGGIAGDITGGAQVLIKNCISKGNIVGDSRVGGIVGYNVSGTCTIDMCINESFIKANRSCAGGIGGSRISIVKNSVNKGDIQSKTEAGGIVGYNGGTIINCYNTGMISSKDSGGITGCYYFSTASILNSYNMGIIKNISETQGAIIGTIYPVSTNVTLDNVFWYENSTDKWIGSGKDKATGEAISITKSQLISTVEDGLLKSLNDYVEIYNNQSEENKTYTNGEDLVYWIMDTENECPTLNFINRK